MESFFQNVLTASFHGSVVILAVLALRLVLRKAPKKFICWLWTLAGLRLLMPIPLQSPFSLQPKTITIPVDLSAYLPILWIAVAVVIGSYSVASYLHLRRKVDDAVKIPGGWESDKIETAFVLGFIRPKIYIPTGMSGATRKQILAHERTHLDKGDHWIKMIGFLALALHWFNPLVWLSYVLLCKDIEMACDERVVQFMELSERKEYSTALLQCSTNHPHYAACPVAFGEVSVKYRIKSVLNYRKPSFWLSVLCLISIAFVAVCLMTSPETVVEVPVDPDAPLQEISHEAPENFTPAVLPEMEPNPDWGIEVIMDATSPTGGKLVYVIEERFPASSEHVTMKNATIDRWNGTAWEPLPSQSGQTDILPGYEHGFAQSRDYAVDYMEQDVDWTLYYGALPAGDYRITQTIESDTDSAVFHTGFHIYREELPKGEEAAIQRCITALDDLYNSQNYSLLFSETDWDGNVSPVKQITRANGKTRIDHYLGQFCTASAIVDEFPYNATGWDAPFRLNQNRRFLFPEGQSVISQEEITFCSAWSDWKGVTYRGTDTFRFNENGSLCSIARLTQALDDKGNVAKESCIQLDAEISPFYSSNSYVNEVESYDYEDSFEVMANSAWNIFFRVDDDYLNPSGGEVWLGVDAVGVSNFTTDGSYWLEKKVKMDVGQPYTWQRLGGEDKEASWADETIPLTSRTTVRNIDWTADYGQLDAGVYRMGKRFYKGEESMIQYAEFAILQVGGIYGEGAEEALARADAAVEKLKSGNYRVEKYDPVFSPYGEGEVLTEVIWKYEDLIATDYYNDAGNYSHTAVKPVEEDIFPWWQRFADDTEYSSIYFPAGYSRISDREISLAQSYTQNTADDTCHLYTYLFDEEGNLTEFIYETRSSHWKGWRTRYVITEAEDSEIKAWVEEKQEEQKGRLSDRS